jgi:hypothetical protein
MSAFPALERLDPRVDHRSLNAVADQALNRGGLLGLVDALGIIATGHQASLISP